MLRLITAATAAKLLDLEVPPKLLARADEVHAVFVDERSLSDIHASLERAAWVLEQETAKGLQERGRRPGQEFV